VVKARAIGILSTSDQDGEDHKIVAVPVSKLDPRWDEVGTYADLPSHVQEELSIYFKEYKKLEKTKYDKITIGGFTGPEQANAHIKAAADAWHA
jgi:inorganic pyrophosphatase